MRILINATNLHVGGGVQVATSFVAELIKQPRTDVDITVWVSSEVDMNLRRIGCDLSILKQYEVFNTYGLKLLFSASRHRFKNFDGIFTVFGPLYIWRSSSVSVVGFAQPWIIYPSNEIYGGLAWRSRVVTRFKYWIQSLFFRRADRLVVELEHVKAALLRLRMAKDADVYIVNNCLSSMYSEECSWAPVAVPEKDCRFRLGFVGRNYPHKNTRIFPEVRNLLLRNHGIDVHFFVTFSDEEWALCSPEFRDAASNVGVLTVSQCPSFYHAMDGVIFPSLLECFSATPLEAMAMRRPLFASDRAFNRDVCGKYALYFDPLDAVSAAEVIANYIKNSENVVARIEEARDHAFSFSDASGRASKYMNCTIRAVVENRVKI
jgi:glycosyltransferase involved in cell wall biosynthesis